MCKLSMSVALIAMVVPTLLAQEQNPVKDPTKFTSYRRYASDFAPPFVAVYRNDSATFVLDGPKKEGLADYRWFDGHHFRDGLQFDPSCSIVYDQDGSGISDVGYLYRVPNKAFWFFFGDEAFDMPGKDTPRFRVYYSQDGKTFHRYSTQGGTTRIPVRSTGSASLGGAPAHRPTRLSLRVGGFLGTTYSLDLQENSLVYRVVPAPPDSATTVKEIVPTAEQWQTFRRAMDQLDVWNWRRDYPNPSNVADGTQWHARIEYTGKALVARGSNNYPRYGAAEPKMLGDRSEAFRRYLAAVEALLGGEAFR